MLENEEKFKQSIKHKENLIRQHIESMEKKAKENQKK
jgi:hypothetical protein